MSGSVEKRFFRKCSEKKPSGCIEWLGWKNNSGYGILKGSKKPYKHLLAHRVAYEIHNGPIPDGLEVRHKCDNKACVNHEHMIVGTRTENMQDMVDRNRQRKSQFNLIDRERIMDMRKNGLTQGEIANHFCVSRPLISMIISGKVSSFKAI